MTTISNNSLPSSCINLEGLIKIPGVFEEITKRLDGPSMQALLFTGSRIFYEFYEANRASPDHKLNIYKENSSIAGSKLKIQILVNSLNILKWDSSLYLETCCKRGNLSGIIALVRTKTFPINNLGPLLIGASKNGILEIVKAFLEPKDFFKDPIGSLEVSKIVAFSQIPINSFEDSLIGASKSDHLAIVKTLMESRKFSEIPIEKLEWTLIKASKNCYQTVLEALIKSKRLSEVSPYSLGKFLKRASKKGYPNILKTFIEEKKFSEIFTHVLETSLIAASQNGHSSVLEALMKSPRFHETSINSFERALIGTSQNGHLDVLEALMKSPRFPETSIDSFLTPKRSIRVSSRFRSSF